MQGRRTLIPYAQVLVRKISRFLSVFLESRNGMELALRIVDGKSTEGGNSREKS